MVKNKEGNGSSLRKFKSPTNLQRYSVKRKAHLNRADIYEIKEMPAKRSLCASICFATAKMRF